MSKGYQKFLLGGGELGELTRHFDWASTSLGAPDRWPSSLLAAVSIVLNSKFPMFIWWGPELIQFYNDAYRPSLGKEGKHPTALGQPGAECWQEIWPVIKPLIDQVLAGGESTWSEDQLIPIYRNNQLEDVYWTFSYSKLLGDDGEIAGVLVTCTETTQKLKALHEIRSAKAELDFAIEAAELGTWDLDPSTNKFIGNKRLKSWFGLTADAEIELPRATDIIADYDLPRVLAAIARAMNYASGGNYEIEYSIINPANAKPRLVKAKGKALFDQDRQVTRFSGILQDITQEQETNTKLREVNRQLELALEQSSLSKIAAQLGTFDMDVVNDTLEWDDRCRVLFGISHRDKVSYQQDFLNGLHPEDRERINEIIKEVMIKSKTNGDYDVEYRTVGADDGKVRWIRAKGKVYFDQNEKPLRFIGSVLDITEQKTDELRKNDFISMVSHELKTPITSLTAYIQMMHAKSVNLNDPFLSTALQKSERQIKKMTALINGFLNTSRLESGKITLNAEEFILPSLIQEVIEEFNALTISETILFHPCEPVKVTGDRDKIGSVITNFISNAIKYSTPGSLVEVSCKREEHYVVVGIKDNGIGIKAEDKERLFDRYYRVDNGISNNVPGFGIGLYISAEVIKRHNGTVEVESEHGKGSLFKFSLPVTNIDSKQEKAKTI